MFIAKTQDDGHLVLNRRRFMGVAAALIAAGALPKSALALAGPQRFTHGTFDLTVLSDGQLNLPLSIVSPQATIDDLKSLMGAAAQPAQAELQLIDQQIERMRLIVTQLLQFARPSEFAGYVDSVQPAAVIDDCLVLVGHLLARTRIDVQRRYAGTRPVAINRQELQQVLVNLLVNAIHAMPDGGRLDLYTRDTDDGRVEVGVADTGPGLPPEVMSQLFQPFVTRKKDGTGLGLWISRSLVERYGADITAANRADAEPGLRGARFTVWLKGEGSA